MRRVAEQDFPFKPGVDVTDVRQVKGLEFDYVVLVEVTARARTRTTTRRATCCTSPPRAPRTSSGS